MGVLPLSTRPGPSPLYRYFCRRPHPVRPVSTHGPSVHLTPGTPGRPAPSHGTLGIPTTPSQSVSHLPPARRRAPGDRRHVSTPTTVCLRRREQISPTTTGPTPVVTHTTFHKSQTNVEHRPRIPLTSLPHPRLSLVGPRFRKTGSSTFSVSTIKDSTPSVSPSKPLSGALQTHTPSPPVRHRHTPTLRLRTRPLDSYTQWS